MLFVDLAIDAFSAFIFMLPVMILLPKYMKKQKVIAETLHKFGMALYVIIISVILTINGIPSLLHMQIDPNLNFIPFKDFTFNYPLYIESGVAFMFLGLLLPTFWRHNRSLKNTMLYGMAFSLFIEIMQIFCSRVTDINDLLFDAIGLCIGYFLFVALYYVKEDLFEHTCLRFRNRKRTSALIRYEFILYMILIFVVMFCVQSAIYTAIWDILYKIALFN